MSRSSQLWFFISRPLNQEDQEQPKQDNTGEDEREDGPERQISHQPLSGDVVLLQELEQVVEHSV